MVSLTVRHTHTSMGFRKDSGAPSEPQKATPGDVRHWQGAEPRRTWPLQLSLDSAATITGVKVKEADSCLNATHVIN